MKFVSFNHCNKASYGILNEDTITDLGKRIGDTYPDLKSLIAAGTELVEDLERAPDLHLNDVELLPPIPNPG